MEEKNNTNIENRNLFDAYINNDFEGIGKALDNGADIKNAKSDDGMTLLMIASINGDIKSVQFFLEKGIDIEAKNDDGMTALIFASMAGKKEIVQLLLDNGADIEVKFNRLEETALRWAVWKKNKEMIQLLLDNGANIEAKNNMGETALIEASSKGLVDIAQLLLDNGADIETKNYAGETALIIASNDGLIEIVQLLLDNGADIEAQSKKSLNSLLRTRTLFIKNKIVKFLANNILDMFESIGVILLAPIKDNKNTALVKASSNGHKDVVELLIENGANIEFIKYKKEVSVNSEITKVIASIMGFMFRLLFRGTPLASITKEEFEKKVLEEKKDLNDFIPYYKYIANQKKIMSSPQKLVTILNNFTKDNPIKYTSHSFEWSQYGSYQKFIDEVKKEFRKIDDELELLSPNLHTKISNFLFSDSLDNDKTWGKYKIGFGWSAPQLKEWCEIEEKKNNAKKAIYFPLPKAYQYEINGKTLTTFDDICTIFKDEIEIRDDDKLNRLFEKIEDEVLGFDFEVEYINLENITFYTDVEYFENAVTKIFEQFSKRAEYDSIVVEADNQESYVEIVIEQRGSKVYRNRDSEKMKIDRGDLQDINFFLSSLCDWSIEAEFLDGNFRVEYLSENQAVKVVELEEKPQGFRHILRFYK